MYVIYLKQKTALVVRIVQRTLESNRSDWEGGEVTECQPLAGPLTEKLSPRLSTPPEWALALGLAAGSAQTLMGAGTGCVHFSALLCPIAKIIWVHNLRSRPSVTVTVPDREGLPRASLSADPRSKGVQSKVFVRKREAFSVLV